MAADLCIAALGSDTGGSIRQPASHCGVVGMKPTYGRVSRYGLVAFASSLDQIGPLTKDVRDAAILLKAIAGHDPKDSTSVPAAGSGLPGRRWAGTIKGLKIGIPQEYFGAGLDPEVDGARCWRPSPTLTGLGAELVEVSLPHTEYAVATYYVLAPAEASSNLARYDGVKYGFRAEGQESAGNVRQTRAQGFGAEVQRRIMLGTYALSAGYYDAYYKKASQVRTLIRRDFEAAFAAVPGDRLAGGAHPGLPPGGKGRRPADHVPVGHLHHFRQPGRDSRHFGALRLFARGLPIGLQLMGPVFGEADLLQAAYAFEQATDFHRRKPPVRVINVSGVFHNEVDILFSPSPGGRGLGGGELKHFSTPTLTLPHQGGGNYKAP